MVRRIIHIDGEKCNGCGACAAACHEGAIGMIDGKATLLRDDYCDGLGDCLPACPTGAITFIEREAAAYNEAAVMAAKKAAIPNSPAVSVPSQLQNFPIQIKLAPINAPYFSGADLLIAADCTAYSYGNFHNDFMKGKVTLIACPKLDAVNYAEKLSQIFANNDIKSITITRMTVPCCGGLPFAVKTALDASGKKIPLNIVTISPDGSLIR
jgi:Fe-S-cluster-containing hydrogenase component 2